MVMDQLTEAKELNRQAAEKIKEYELLEEAKRRYPIGTRYYYLDDKETLIIFEPVYGKEMLYGTPTELGFFEHWSQPNKSNTKFKMELEKTWALSARLKTWYRNRSQWQRNNNSKFQQNISHIQRNMR